MIWLFLVLLVHNLQMNWTPQRAYETNEDDYFALLSCDTFVSPGQLAKLYHFLTASS